MNLPRAATLSVVQSLMSNMSVTAFIAAINTTLAGKAASIPDLVQIAVFGALFFGTTWVKICQGMKADEPTTARLKAIVKLLREGAAGDEAAKEELAKMAEDVAWVRKALETPGATNKQAAEAFNKAWREQTESVLTALGQSQEQIKARLDEMAVLEFDTNWRVRDVQKTVGRIEGTLDVHAADSVAGHKKTHDILERYVPPPQTCSSNFPDLGIAPNANFVGRAAELLSLRAALFPPPGADDKQRAAALTQGFSGEGGIGKSQLAQRFAYLSCKALGGGGTIGGADWDLFDCAWWLDCKSATHADAASKLAKLLGHERNTTDSASDDRAAIRAWLDAESRHLLILDNLEAADDAPGSPASGASRWAAAEGWSLPVGSRVLITTREQHLPTSLASTVQLDVLSREDARALLRSARKDLQGAAHDAALDAVTNHLGRHALALDLARAWLSIHHHETPASLLTELKASDAAALALFEDDAIKDQAHRYRLSVAASLALHLEELKGTDAEKLLFAAAFAAPDRIPMDLLADVVGTDRATARDAFALLASKSILYHKHEDTGGLVSMHRLTQAVVRARLAKSQTVEPARVLAAWIQVLHALHESHDHDDIRPKRAAAAPHAAAVADHALADPSLAGLHRGAAICHWKRADHSVVIGNLDAAEGAIEKAVAWAESNRPAADRDTMIFLASRAVIRQQRRDFPGAEADIQKCIDWGEVNRPREDRSLAIWRAIRASIREHRGNISGAEDDITWSIDWEETQTPRNDRELAVRYATRADIRRCLDRFADAEADIQKSINWELAQSPRDGRGIAFCFAKRASIRRQRGLHTKAEEDITRSIEWCEEQTPSNARDLAVWYASRAGIRQERGDLPGAEADIQQSITWGEAQSPRDERGLAILHASRASIRQQRGDLPGAEADIQRSITWGEAQSPRDERSLAIWYASRASIRKQRGDLPGAEADIQQSITWGEAQSPRDERELAIRYASRASIRAAQAQAARQAGDKAQAAALFALAQRDIAGALAWFEEHLPTDTRRIDKYREDKSRIDAAAGQA